MEGKPSNLILNKEDYVPKAERVSFGNVTQLLFLRQQGNAVPSDGDISLGMDLTPQEVQQYSVDTFEEIRNQRTSVRLRPLTCNKRWNMLYAAGMGNYDFEEVLQSKWVKESRKNSGCHCLGSCETECCSCFAHEIPCQTRRSHPPCKCNTEVCSNPFGSKRDCITRSRNRNLERKRMLEVLWDTEDVSQSSSPEPQQIQRGQGARPRVSRVPSRRKHRQDELNEQGETTVQGIEEDSDVSNASLEVQPDDPSYQIVGDQGDQLDVTSPIEQHDHMDQGDHAEEN